MTTQQDQKIEELSHKNRVLVDKVSVLERENRKLKERYAVAATRVLELETESEYANVEISKLHDKLEEAIALLPTDTLVERFRQQLEQGLLSPFGNNDGEGFEIPQRKTGADNG